MWYLPNGGLFLRSSGLLYIDPAGKQFDVSDTYLFDPHIVQISKQYIAFDTGYLNFVNENNMADRMHLYRWLSHTRNLHVYDYRKCKMVLSGSETLLGTPIRVDDKHLFTLRAINLRESLVSERVIPKFEIVRYNIPDMSADKRWKVSCRTADKEEALWRFLAVQPVAGCSLVWSSPSHLSLKYGRLEFDTNDH